MKERPILFSAPMVRAILEGRKTQTRRIVNSKPSACLTIEDIAAEPTYYVQCGHCPYGQPRDRLWVKETFGVYSGGDDMTLRYPATPKAYRATGPGTGEIPNASLPLYYKMADKSAAKGKEVTYPSIFMPRWASRIQLEVTGVRVERLNRCSEADAKAEGADPATWESISLSPHISAYSRLWEQINGAGSWAKNPWVWVIEFRKV